MNNEKVFVYRNLHKGCLSVKSKKTGLVIAHVQRIFLADVTFKVSQKGRERVLNERRKNVHAGVEGTWINDIESFESKSKIVYNPYKYNTFVDSISLEPRAKSDTAMVTIEGAFVQS